MYLLNDVYHVELIYDYLLLYSLQDYSNVSDLMCYVYIYDKY